LEAHYALSIYYNSLVTVSNNLTFVTSSTVDAFLQQIQMNLRNDMICRYRLILNVYSYAWSWINEVGQIKFSARKYHDAISLTSDVRVIIIVRLLREWMRRIHTVMINLESKLF
jgi:hypothetical protein